MCHVITLVFSLCYQVVGGTGLGAHVARHRPVRLQPEPDEGPQPVPQV